MPEHVRAATERPLVCPTPFLTRPPFWGGHLQTIAASRRRRPVGDDGRPVILRIPAEDGSGDELAAEWLEPARPTGPLVVVLHGLGGSASSPSMRWTARALVEAGHPVLLPDGRGIGRSARSCRYFLHAGRTDDVATVLRAAANPRLAGDRASLAARGVVLVGVSLGGSLALRFLGEDRVDRDRLPPLLGAATTSAPMNLEATSRRLSQWTRWPYARSILTRIRRQLAASTIDLSPAEWRAARTVRSVWDLDDRITGPRSGYPSAATYYAACSAGPVIHRVAVPTLAILAGDDPLVDLSEYAAIDWAGIPNVRPVIVRSGGHAGFLDRAGGHAWSDRRLVEWVRERSAATGRG